MTEKKPWKPPVVRTIQEHVEAWRGALARPPIEVPSLPVVLGSGPLADEARRLIAQDPDRYRPRTTSIDPVGHCRCCKHDVFRVRSPLTGFAEAFATSMGDDAILHARLNDDGKLDRAGTRAGCCCVPPNWGPEHSPPASRRKKSRGHSTKPTKRRR